MADRSSRRGRIAAVLFALLTAGGACNHHIDSESRLLEEACAVDECATTGTARRSTALTSESIAFKLGPGPGKVVIPIPSFSRPGADSFQLEALVDGSATFRLIQSKCTSASGPCTDELLSTTSVYSGDYDWHYAGGYVGSSDQFDGFKLEIETNASQELALVDLRYDTYDTVVDCSVSAPGRRR